MKRFLYIVLVVAIFNACESETRMASIEMFPEVDAYVGNTIVLEVSHSPANALVPAYHFKTNDQFVASVDEQGMIVCNHVGVCTVIVATADKRFSSTCIVHVKPINELFDLPVLDYNASKTAVKLKESDRTIVSETPNMLIYQDHRDSVQQVIYLFDETQKLTSAAVKLNAGASSELTVFMDEHYNRFESADSDGLLTWRGNTTEVIAKESKDACFVVFNPFSGKSTYTKAVHAIETIRSSGQK